MDPDDLVRNVVLSEYRPRDEDSIQTTSICSRTSGPRVGDDGADRGRDHQPATCARRRGLSLDTLSGYAIEPDGHRPRLVIGYATPPSHAYTSTLARLCAAIADPR